MTTTERLAFANALSEKSYLEDDWQTVVENGCKLLEEEVAIEFGFKCASRAFGSWMSCFPKDDRVRNALASVQQWLAGEDNLEQLKQAALAASDAAVESDDPDDVPSNQRRTRALHSANAASSIADAARSACEPVGQRALRPDAVATAIGYAVKFSVSASNDASNEYEWQLGLLRRYLMNA